MSKINGTVKFFDEIKGYGFILGEDNEDYFVHKTQILNNLRITEGDKVNFEPVETDRGQQAGNVELELNKAGGD